MLLPVIACLINTLSNGKGICDVFPSASEGNDELFYFKQIECMVADGIPKGFFGYNESTAASLSFGAWNPLLLVWWATFGKIFGFSYLTMIAANIVILSCAMFLFGLFARPSLKSNIALTVWFLLTTPIARYMLSWMPEIVIISFAVVVTGLLVGYRGCLHKGAYYTAILVLIGVLTILRPYMAVFYIFPFLIAGKNETGRKLSLAVTAVVSLLLYYAMEKRFTAPYFTDVYSTDFLSEFKNFGLLAGLKNMIFTVGHYAVAVASACVGAFKTGYPVGIYFAAFIILMIMSAVMYIIRRKKEPFEARLYIGMFVADIVMLLAIVFMYSLHDGFRHLLIFIVTGELMLAAFTDRYPVKESVLAVLFLILFVICAKDPVYFKPYFDGEGSGITKAEIGSINAELTGKMVPGDELSWDNTVCLVFKDSRGDDQASSELTKWQYAYALPKGFAISYVTSEYVLENDCDVRSGYILTMTGGTVARALSGQFEPVYENHDIIIFKSIP